MSSGGQRGIDVSGITNMRLRDASDVTTRERVKLVYQTFASTTGANAYVNTTPNAVGSYVDFLTGTKEGCAVCVGLPWQMRLNRSFRT